MPQRWFRVPKIGSGDDTDAYRPDLKGIQITAFAGNVGDIGPGSTDHFIVTVMGDQQALDSLAGHDGVESYQQGPPTDQLRAAAGVGPDHDVAGGFGGGPPDHETVPAFAGPGGPNDGDGGGRGGPPDAAAGGGSGGDPPGDAGAGGTPDTDAPGGVTDNTPDTDDGSGATDPS